MSDVTDWPKPPDSLGQSLSDGLRTAIGAEIGTSGVKGPTPDDTLRAAEAVYALEGEDTFDPMNPSDMLARALVIAEAANGCSG